MHRAPLKHRTAGCSEGWEQPKQRLSHTLFLDTTEEQTRGSNNSKTNNTHLNLNLIWKVRGSQWREASTDVLPLSLPREELWSHIFNLLNLVQSKMQRFAVIQTNCWKYMNYILKFNQWEMYFYPPQEPQPEKACNCAKRLLSNPQRVFFFLGRSTYRKKA